MGKHLSAVYSPVKIGLPGQGVDTFEYIRYSFPEFIHPIPPQNPVETHLYTRGFWLNPHPANGQAAFGKFVEGHEGLFIRLPATDESIIAVADVADVALPGMDGFNVSLILTNKRFVYAQAYSDGGPGSFAPPGEVGETGQYVSVFDENWGDVPSPPTFLDMAALEDIDNQEIHAITLAVDNHENGLIFDWFGGVPFGNDLGSWALIPFLFTRIPGGRLVAASYSQSLKERDILVATTNAITLIRSTKHSTQQEDFASFPGEKIISLTSFSVPDDTAQRAVVATTSDDIVYHLWEIAYERSVAQPLLIGTLQDFNLLEISGYANPTESLRHIAILTTVHQLFRGSYNQSGGGFQFTPWPDLPVALPS